MPSSLPFVVAFRDSRFEPEAAKMPNAMIFIAVGRSCISRNGEVTGIGMEEIGVASRRILESVRVKMATNNS